MENRAPALRNGTHIPMNLFAFVTLHDTLEHTDLQTLPRRSACHSAHTATACSTLRTNFASHGAGAESHTQCTQVFFAHHELQLVLLFRSEYVRVAGSSRRKALASRTTSMVNRQTLALQEAGEQGASVRWIKCSSVDRCVAPRWVAWIPEPSDTTTTKTSSTLHEVNWDAQELQTSVASRTGCSTRLTQRR